MRRLIAFAVLIGLFSVAAFGQIRPSDKRLATVPDSGSYFLGTAEDEKCGGRVTWLIYIDTVMQTGKIFIVPDMVGFSEFSLGVDGILKFKAFTFEDYFESFNGTLRSGEINGEIQFINGGTGELINKWQLTATRLPAQNKNFAQAVLPERYSNLEYSDEGGDWVGVDIRFFAKVEGMTGMIIFHNGAFWGEPEFTPMALSRIEVNKGTIHFEADTPTGVARYHLRPKGKKWLFNRDDVEQENRVEDTVLKRRRPLLPVAGER